MGLVLLTLLGVFHFEFAHAAKVNYPIQKLKADGVTAIAVSGVRGQVRISGRTGRSYRLQVRHTKGKDVADWHLSVDRRGSTLHLEVFSVAHGAQWRKHVSQELWPEFDIDLSGPSVPLTLSWREGDVEFKNWNAAVETSLIKGRVSVKDGAGDYKFILVETDVKVDGLNGGLDLKGERGDVDITRHGGTLDGEWLDGEWKVIKPSGATKLNLKRGHADLRVNKGELKLEGESARWTLSTRAPGSVQITSQSGPVELNWLSGGVKAFLTSRSGALSAPGTKAIDDGQGIQILQLKRGSAPFGEVFVKTESAAVRLSL